MRDARRSAPGRAWLWRLRSTLRLFAGKIGVGGIAIAVVVIAAALAPWLAPRAPDAIDLGHRLQPPSWAEPFGTDAFGRSVLGRVLYGARVSLLVGITVVGVGGGIGAAVGGVAGYAGGPLERTAMRGVDVLLSFPPLLLALAVIGVFGPGLRPTIVALTLVEIPIFARLARSAVLPVRDAPHVIAARALGAREHRIFLRHVLPSALGVLVAHASVAVGYAVLALAGLSFLGLGVQPPTPDWGGMIAESRSYIVGRPNAPWLLVGPSLALAIAVLGFLLVGDEVHAVRGDDHLGRGDVSAPGF